MKSSTQDKGRRQVAQSEGQDQAGRRKSSREPRPGKAEGDAESIDGKVQEKVGQIKDVVGK